MNEKQSYDIYGYEELSRWNRREANALLSYDRVYVSVSLIAIGASVSSKQYHEIYPYTFVGVWLLLSYWVLLCWRFKIRYGQRFDIMVGIECDLGFAAHKAMRDKPNPMGENIHEQHLRYSFYGVTLLAAAGLSFLPDIRMHLTGCTHLLYFALPLLLSGFVALILCINNPEKKKKNNNVQ